MLDGEYVVITDHLEGRNQVGPKLAPVAVADGTEQEGAVFLVAVGLRIQDAVDHIIHVIHFRVFGVAMEDSLTQYANGGAGIDALPEHMTGIEVATQSGARLSAQAQHGLRIVDRKPRMHLDGNAHAVVLRELGALAPEWNHLLLPLPFQQVEIVRWPRGRRPVGILGVVGIARTTGEVDNRVHPQPLRQQNRAPVRLRRLLSEFLVRVKRVAMATQSADRDALIVKPLLEFLDLCRIVQQVQLEVSVARTVSRTQLNRPDSKRLDLLDHVVEAELGKEHSE